MSSRASSWIALALAAVAVVVAGCGGKKPDPEAKPAAVPIAIFQDDRQIATTATLGATPRPLVEVVPGLPAPETWLAIVVFDAAGTATTAMAPSTNRPDAAAALSAGKDGVTFGFARGGALETPVARIVKLVVKTKDDRGAIAAELKAQGGEHAHGGGDSGGGGHEGDGKDRPVPTAELKIEIADGPAHTVLTGDKLVGLPTIHAPIGDLQTPGWNLLDVLAAAGLAKAGAVNLTDEEGANLRLEGADLDPAATVLYIKLNRSGQIRFRRYGKKGAAWEMTGELRGITKIAVVR